MPGTLARLKITGHEWPAGARPVRRGTGRLDGSMNENHQGLCGSPEWAAQLQETVLPRVSRDVDLGLSMLEIGPGPGAATDWLRHRVASLTAIEIDPVAAGKLRDRFAGTNVEIVTGDATRLPWPDDSF